MKKILILLTTFMGLMGLVFPNFNEKDIKISQINHDFDEKEIIKPNAVRNLKDLRVFSFF